MADPDRANEESPLLTRGKCFFFKISTLGITPQDYECIGLGNCWPAHRLSIRTCLGSPPPSKYAAGGRSGGRRNSDAIVLDKLSDCEWLMDGTGRERSWRTWLPSCMFQDIATTSGEKPHYYSTTGGNFRAKNCSMHASGCPLYFLICIVWLHCIYFVLFIYHANRRGMMLVRFTASAADLQFRTLFTFFV